MMEQEQEQDPVYFLKMVNGEDLLCLIVDIDEYCVHITNPYRIMMVPSHTTRSFMPIMVSWLPFDSLMREITAISKKNILTYMPVDDIVATRYLEVIRSRSPAGDDDDEEESQFAGMMVANNLGKFH
jgi:sRNA-binding regulator protein Hfq